MFLIRLMKQYSVYLYPLSCLFYYLNHYMYLMQCSYTLKCIFLINLGQYQLNPTTLLVAVPVSWLYLCFSH